MSSQTRLLVGVLAFTALVVGCAVLLWHGVYGWTIFARNECQAQDHDHAA